MASNRCPNLRSKNTVATFLGGNMSFSCSIDGRKIDLEYVRNVCKNTCYPNCNQYKRYGIVNSR